MQKLVVVMGANATGKTYFIEHQFAGKDVEILNVYDYQQRMYEQYGDKIPFHEEFVRLWEANQKFMQDTIEKLKQGRNVVVEQTFYKAKRRIAFVDEVRKVIPNIEIELYFMNPTEEEWTEYIRERGMPITATMSCKEAIDIPNVVEGFDDIYAVRNKTIKKLDSAPTPEIIAIARKEIAEEKERIEQKKRLSEERRKFLESFETRSFWHICEVCGKKEWITAAEAFDSGWDYPPRVGKFGLLSPRTCGDCFIDKTLYWKSLKEKERFPYGIVVEKNLTEQELSIWRRIKREPEGLLEENSDGD